jgi:aminomethyltransferase
MVPFAGYEMPVQFQGVMPEHNHTRRAAGLFDVSHMGQVRVTAPAEALEALMPVDVAGLKEGRQRYGLLTNDAGGILDDLMFANMGDHFIVIVNAACKEADIAHLRSALGEAAVEVLEDRALIALQGPQAEAALEAVGVSVGTMRFMDYATRDAFGGLMISRSGYTGEDGFEISVPADKAEDLADVLLGQDSVLPIGLGARDSLRLEAGLCLYGNDIDTTTTPIEAGLKWAIGKARRSGGARAGGFLGDAVILKQLENGPSRMRVGLLPEGRAPMRDGVTLHTEPDAPAIGHVTSGGFGPSVGGPIAMGYVPTPLSAPGTQLFGCVRGKFLPATVSAMPFTANTYKR